MERPPARRSSTYTHIQARYEGDYGQKMIALLEQFRTHSPRDELDRVAAQIRTGLRRVDTVP